MRAITLQVHSLRAIVLAEARMAEALSRGRTSPHLMEMVFSTGMTLTWGTTCSDQFASWDSSFSNRLLQRSRKRSLSPGSGSRSNTSLSWSMKSRRSFNRAYTSPSGNFFLSTNPLLYSSSRVADIDASSVSTASETSLIVPGNSRSSLASSSERKNPSISGRYADSRPSRYAFESFANISSPISSSPDANTSTCVHISYDASSTDGSFPVVNPHGRQIKGQGRTPKPTESVQRFSISRTLRE